jgi:titin
VGANVKTFNNTGLVPGTTYWYRVRAYNADGAGPFSNVRRAATLP